MTFALFLESPIWLSVSGRTHRQGTSHAAAAAAGDGEAGGDAVQHRESPGPTAPVHPSPEDLEPERHGGSYLGSGGENEQRRARAFRGARESYPRDGASRRRGGDVVIEHDQSEAPSAEEDLGGAQCIAGIAWPHPQRA